MVGVPRADASDSLCSRRAVFFHGDDEAISVEYSEVVHRQLPLSCCSYLAVVAVARSKRDYVDRHVVAWEVTTWVAPGSVGTLFRAMMRNEVMYGTTIV